MVIVRELKGLSEETIKLPATSDNSLNPRLDYIDNPTIRAKFDGICLMQEKATFNHKNILNFYIVFEEKLFSCKVGTNFE